MLAPKPLAPLPPRRTRAKEETLCQDEELRALAAQEAAEVVDMKALAKQQEATAKTARMLAQEERARCAAGSRGTRMMTRARQVWEDQKPEAEDQFASKVGK